MSRSEMFIHTTVYNKNLKSLKSESLVLSKIPGGHSESIQYITVIIKL